MTIDERLLKVVDKITRTRKTTRSAFIRDALEAEIRRQRIHEDEIRHGEGYTRKPVASGEFDIWVSEQDWGTSRIAVTSAGTRSKHPTRSVRC